MRRALVVVFVAGLACTATEPVAEDASPTPGVTVLAAPALSGPVPLDTLQVCTLLTVGEIVGALALAVTAPVPTAEAARPECSWSAGGQDAALVLQVSDGAGFAPPAIARDVEGLGDAAAFLDADGADELHVFLETRDRAFVLALGAQVDDPEAALRVLARAILGRL